MEPTVNELLDLLKEVLTVTKSDPKMSGATSWHFEPSRGQRVSDIIQKVRTVVFNAKK